MSIITAGQQMFIMFLLILIGFFCCRKHYISKENSACISKLIVDIFNPCMIISSVLGNSSERTGDPILPIFAAAAGLYLFQIIIGKMLSHFETGSKMNKHITELLYIFANVGFIGIPVIKAILGTSYLVYVAVYILFFNLLFYTYAAFLVNENDKFHFSLKALKPLINPGTFACLGTLIIFICNISIPQIIATPFQYLANATTPLSLMVIGVSLGLQDDLLALFTNARRYLFSFAKLLLIPIIGTFVLKRFPLSEELCQTYMILLAMPCANIILMLCQDQNVDSPLQDECANKIILSTLLSILTIPIMIFLYPYL